METLESKARWYVMQVMSGQENKVFASIDFDCGRMDAANRVYSDDTVRKYHSQFNGYVYGIYELNIPYECVEERKPGHKKLVARERKLYPGYILIRMALYDENDVLIPANLSYLRDVKGVIGLIGGQEPVPLSEAEVQEMTAKAAAAVEGQSRPKIKYNVGEAVLIKEGAFENCEGTIEHIDDERGKLKVSVSIFGRFTPVEVDFEQVERPE